MAIYLFVFMVIHGLQADNTMNIKMFAALLIDGFRFKDVMALYMFVCMVIIGLAAAADDVKCWNKPCMCCAKGACTTQGDKTFTCNGCISGYTGHNCYEPCQENCVNCSQTFFINDRTCYTCKNGYYNGRREDIADFPVQNDCSLSCQPACESCTSYYKCTKCKTGYYMSNRKDCHPCADNCAYCLSPAYCQQCKNGFFLDDDDNTCKPCKAYCKTCRSYQTCTECDDGFYLDDNMCRLCEDPCIVCSGLDNCNECHKGHYLNNGRCSNCRTPCIKCSSDDSCIACQSGYFVHNGQCHLCPETCIACLSHDQNQSCAGGFYGRNCSLRCPHNCNNDQCTTKAGKQSTSSEDRKPVAANLIIAFGVTFIVVIVTLTIISIVYLKKNRAIIRIKGCNHHMSPSGIAKYQCMFGVCSVIIEDLEATPSAPQESTQDLIPAQTFELHTNAHAESDQLVENSQTLYKDNGSDSDDEYVGALET